MSERLLWCMSHPSFDKMMEEKGWIAKPDKGAAIISISSPNEDDLAGHWFDNVEGVFNLDIDDVGPVWFKNSQNQCYDDSMELYLNNKVKKSNSYFNYIQTYDNGDYVLIHSLDYEEAVNLVSFIDDAVKSGKDFYIHCAVGASRSQAVVRYILDMYPDIEWETNPNNPCITPNAHVLMMLKRANRIDEICGGTL